MTNHDAIEDYRRRYTSAAHAMQTGVSYKMQHAPGETSPKHLRVGVNSAHVSHAALVKLLLDKGIISEEEYYRAQAEQMETERDTYQDWLNRFYGERGGSQVTLL